MGLFVLLNQVEAERLRLVEARRNAEAYGKFSANAADHLASFLSTTIRARGSPTPAQMTAALLGLRDSAIDLKNQGILPSSTIAFLEEEIGWALVWYGKPEGARDLLRHAVSDLERSLAKNPADRDTQRYLVDGTLLSGYLAEDAGEFEEALGCFERTADLRMAVYPGDSMDTCLLEVCRRLPSFSDRFKRDGETRLEERSRRLSRRILRYYLGSDAQRSTTESSPGLEVLGTLLRREGIRAMATHEDRGLRRSFVDFVSQWLAQSDEIASPFRSSMVAAEFDRDPDAGAIAFLAAIRGQCSKLGVPDSVVPTTIRFVADDAVARAGKQRSLGRIDDARATAPRLMAIARRGVRDYPDSASSHAALSLAYNQIKKNAYRDEDFQLVEKAIAESIEAARRAIALDPDDLEMRRHLEYLTRQLASAKAERDAGRPRPR